MLETNNFDRWLGHHLVWPAPQQHSQTYPDSPVQQPSFAGGIQREALALRRGHQLAQRGDRDSAKRRLVARVRRAQDSATHQVQLADPAALQGRGFIPLGRWIIEYHIFPPVLYIRSVGNTQCAIHSVVKFCFALDMKFWLPIGLHSSCSISPPASGTCENFMTKYHGRGDVAHCSFAALQSVKFS